MLVLTLLVLGMVLQPVLAAVAEYHEIEHSPPGTHAHALHADQPVGNVDQPLGTALDVSPAEDAPVLHVLLHFAHCCGGTAAVLVGDPTLSTTAASDTVAGIDPQAPQPVPLPAPFKPPING